MLFRSLTSLLCLLGVALASCGPGGEQETSFHLIVNNGLDTVAPSEVQIDVYEGTSSQLRESINRGVPPTATTRLGDVVIYPAAGTPSLRFVVFGRKEGLVVSSAVVSAAPKAGAQIEVVATLKAGGGETPSDGGPSDDAGFDAGQPIDDGGSVEAGVPKKAAGLTCVAGAECTSGSCVGQVCCDKTCDGSCNTCKAAGMPAGRCVPLADNTKCREPTCSANEKSLTEYKCKVGVCENQPRNCASRMCDAATLMCQ